MSSRSVDDYKIEIMRLVATLLERDTPSDRGLIISALVQAAAEICMEVTDTATTAQILRAAAREVDSLTAHLRRIDPLVLAAAARSGPDWHVTSSCLSRTSHSNCASYEIELLRPFGTIIENSFDKTNGIDVLELAEQVAESVREDLFPHLVRAVDDMLRSQVSLSIVAPTSSAH